MWILSFKPSCVVVFDCLLTVYSERFPDSPPHLSRGGVEAVVRLSVFSSVSARYLFAAAAARQRARVVRSERMSDVGLVYAA